MAEMEIDSTMLAGFVTGRRKESHKNDYGHLLLVCGCDTMPGAASLATAAALKSGCGLVTLHSSASAAGISAVSNPSAILSIDADCCFSRIPDNLAKYNAIAVGPGLGCAPQTAAALRELFLHAKKAGTGMVIDADALNIIARNPEMIDLLPENSILTPHDGELARLISWKDNDDKILRTQELADRTRCAIISKGWHSRVFLPCMTQPYINTSGNPGMAKGGSGDVLTGLAGGLLARGYRYDRAAMLAVWIHGFAGDACTDVYGMEAWNSKDLIDRLYKGFTDIGLKATI